MKRLTQLSVARQANASGETLSYFASALWGFSEAALDLAIEQLSEEPVKDYQTRWPEVGKFQQACRDAEQQLRQPAARKPYCAECENEFGYLFFDRQYRGKRLRGAEIGDAGTDERFVRRCPCGGSYRQPRAEA